MNANAGVFHETVREYIAIQQHWHYVVTGISFVPVFAHVVSSLKIKLDSTPTSTYLFMATHAAHPNCEPSAYRCAFSCSVKAVGRVLQVVPFMLQQFDIGVISAILSAVLNVA